MNRIYYLDNAATTLPVYNSFNYNKYWFNSNANYSKDIVEVLDKARDRIKKCLGVNSGYVLFTRSATESIEWLSNRLGEDDRLCSPYEHDSVYKACNGIVLDEDAMDYYMCSMYTLYCHQLTNQIDGSIWDIKSIHDKYILNKNRQFFGVDLTASIGKVDLPPNMDEYCDAMWYSGHKINCEKGIGVLWLGDKLFNYVNGCSNNSINQYGLIHGTLNVPAVLALTSATENAIMYKDEDKALFKELIQCFKNELNKNGIKYHQNISEESIDHTEAINLFTFEGINADALQQYLANRYIYVGLAASACTDDHDYRVPIALGITEDDAKQSIRISLSCDSDEYDMKALANGIKDFKELFA